MIASNRLRRLPPRTSFAVTTVNGIQPLPVTRIVVPWAPDVGLMMIEAVAGVGDGVGDGVDTVVRADDDAVVIIRAVKAGHAGGVDAVSGIERAIDRADPRQDRATRGASASGLSSSLASFASFAH